MDDDVSSSRRRTVVEAGDSREGVDTRLKRHSVASRLFGKPVEPVRLGRFVILQHIGSGGMGTVYRAYDPNLDRAVALKVLNRELHATEQAHIAIAQEAKVLAKLSHPNVVTVFEVGESDDGHIYVAMELVSGGNLCEWFERHRDDDAAARFERVLDLLMQAGEGLAAAHEAGVVHRDFKPANVLVGDDGRVRVADFGLALRGEPNVTPTDAIDDRESTLAMALEVRAGTPAYMAPEQRAGQRVEARADQFSFCVTAWELLWGRRPDLRVALPERPQGLVSRDREVADILLRGLSEQPSARFPSMRELLDALKNARAENGFHARRRRRWAMGITTALVGVGLVIAWSGGIDPCARGSAVLGEAWPTDERRALLAQLENAADPLAESASQRLQAMSDAFSATWVARYRDACLQHRRGQTSAALHDRQMACLLERRSAWMGLEEALRSETRDVARILTAATDLPNPDDCIDLDRLLGEPEVPQDRADSVVRTQQTMARARTLVTAGELLQARAVVTQAIAQARHDEYEPVLANALVLLGQIEIESDGQNTDALVEATHRALRAGVYPLAIEAWARRAWIIGIRQGQPERAMEGVTIIEDLASGLEQATFARALLHNNLGSLAMAQGRREQARQRFVRANDLARQHTGTGSSELRRVAINLAMVTDDVAARERLLDDVIASATDQLGPDHPLTLDARFIQAISTRDPDRARDRVLDVCERVDQLHPHLVRTRVDCRVELGWIALAAANPELAEASFAQGYAVSKPIGDNELIHGWSLVFRAPKQAETIFERIIAGETANLDELPWWRRRAWLEANIGWARVRSNGDVRATLRQLETLFDVQMPELNVRRIEVAAQGLPPATALSLHKVLAQWRVGRVSTDTMRQAIRAL